MNDTARPNDPFETVSGEARARLHAAEAAIAGLGATYSPEALFAAAFVYLVVRPEGAERHAGSDSSTATLERLVFLLWNATPGGQALPTADVVGQLLAHSGALALDAMLAQATSAQPTPVDGIVRRVLIDAHVVRGSAYPEQTLAEVRGIFGQFDAWYLETLGASASELADCILAIARGAEEQLNAWRDEIRTDAHERLIAIDLPIGPRAKRRRRLVRRLSRATAYRAGDERIAREAATLFIDRQACQLPGGDSPPEATWAVLLRLIGLDRNAARGMNNALAVRSRPIVISDDGRALMPNVSTAADALWDALDAHGKTHPRFHTELPTWKGRWLEARVVEYLRRVFGHEAVYANLRYPNPDRAERQPTELDAAVVHGPFIFLIEVKARQFSLRSQLGDPNGLRDELRANIDDAFEQALRARRYLVGSDTAVFHEAGTGRSLSVSTGRLAGIVLMTVSLHFLGGAATRLAELRGLGLMGRNEYPWALSVSELDLITRVCEGPDVFIHYGRRRLEVERAEEFPMNDDLDLYAAYLSTRLNREDFQSLAPRADFVYLADYQEVFDGYVVAERRGRPLPDLGLVLPQSVKEVLFELRRQGASASAVAVALVLLDLSRGHLAQLGQALVDIRAQRPAPGVFRRLALTLGDLAVSFTVASDGPLPALVERTAQRAAREKYRRRTPKAVGFGIHHGLPPRAFHAYTWLEGEWAPDTSMERQLAEEEGWLPASQRLPGRNAPCVCGSGRKFKKCCIDKLSR